MAEVPTDGAANLRGNHTLLLVVILFLQKTNRKHETTQYQPNNLYIV
jgi:hypothetical protein